MLGLVMTVPVPKRRDKVKFIRPLELRRKGWIPQHAAEVKSHRNGKQEILLNFFLFLCHFDKSSFYIFSSHQLPIIVCFEHKGANPLSRKTRGDISSKNMSDGKRGRGRERESQKGGNLQFSCFNSFDWIKSNSWLFVCSRWCVWTPARK